MLRMRTGARRGLRWGLLGLATAIALTAVTTDPADAARRRKGKAASGYDPPYAAIVVDANSGKVLHSSNADAQRHPASLTKIMTLYLLFERLDSGKLTLDGRLYVSEHAADQSPTKLGLTEGSWIRVDDAIKGMVTRSANDAAVVVAENLGGSETEFAKMMTRKAHALGMTKTVYRNASGLPDDAQVTTARDQAILGRAIQERFPRYYKYFSTRSFTYQGQQIGNHNRLLSKVEGVDGIKTGFIRASGFNLVTSVKRNDRHLVAVVLGGKSAATRDARMRSLITEHIQTASTRRTAPMIAEAPARSNPDSKTTERYALASAEGAPMRLTPSSVSTPRAAPPAGSADPIRPTQVKTVSVKPGPARQTASVAPMHLPSAPAPAAAPPETVKAETPPPRRVARAGMLGVLPVSAPTASVPEPAQAAGPVLQSAPAPTATPSRQQTRSGWVIQVGALPSESEARQRLSLVKSKATRLLAAADPFTEPVQKGETTLYRARFAGFDREKAEAACKFLKRNDVDCLAIKI